MVVHLSVPVPSNRTISPRAHYQEPRRSSDREVEGHNEVYASVQNVFA